MDVLTRNEWGAQPPNRDYVPIGWADRPGLETHHSVGTYEADTAAEFAWRVQDDHLGRNWTDVFYNYLIWLDGQIVEARPDHAKSGPIEHLTVCFAGNYDHRLLTDPQKLSWWQLRDYLRGNGGGPAIAWHGQRASVGCPGGNVIGWLRAGHPRPQQQEEDVNVMPLVREDGTDEVWLAAGSVLIHVTADVWNLIEPRKHTEVKVLPADHPVMRLPKLRL